MPAAAARARARACAAAQPGAQGACTRVCLGQLDSSPKGGCTCYMRVRVGRRRFTGTLPDMRNPTVSVVRGWGVVVSNSFEKRETPGLKEVDPKPH